MTKVSINGTNYSYEKVVVNGQPQIKYYGPNGEISPALFQQELQKTGRKVYDGASPISESTSDGYFRTTDGKYYNAAGIQVTEQTYLKHKKVDDLTKQQEELKKPKKEKAKSFGSDDGASLGAMWKGCKKFFGNMVGEYDKKGEWHFSLAKTGTTLLTCAGIAVGAAILVGAEILTAGQVTWLLVGVGVASGAVTAGTGMYKASKAETEEERLQAYEEIGGGLAEVGMSVAIKKGFNKQMTGVAHARDAAKMASYMKGEGAVTAWAKGLGAGVKTTVPGYDIIRHPQKTVRQWREAKANAKELKAANKQAKTYFDEALKSDRTSAELMAQLRDSQMSGKTRTKYENKLYERNQKEIDNLQKARNSETDQAKLDDIEARLKKAQALEYERVQSEIDQAAFKPRRFRRSAQKKYNKQIDNNTRLSSEQKAALKERIAEQKEILNEIAEMDKHPSEADYRAMLDRCENEQALEALFWKIARDRDMLGETFTPERFSSNLTKDTRIRLLKDTYGKLQKVNPEKYTLDYENLEIEALRDLIKGTKNFKRTRDKIDKALEKNEITQKQHELLVKELARSEQKAKYNDLLKEIEKSKDLKGTRESLEKAKDENKLDPKQYEELNKQLKAKENKAKGVEEENKAGGDEATGERTGDSNPPADESASTSETPADEGASTSETPANEIQAGGGSGRVDNVIAEINRMSRCPNVAEYRAALRKCETMEQLNALRAKLNKHHKLRIKTGGANETQRGQIWREINLRECEIQTGTRMVNLGNNTRGVSYNGKTYAIKEGKLYEVKADETVTDNVIGTFRENDGYRTINIKDNNTQIDITMSDGYEGNSLRKTTTNVGGTEIEYFENGERVFYESEMGFSDGLSQGQIVYKQSVYREFRKGTVIDYVKDAKGNYVEVKINGEPAKVVDGRFEYGDFSYGRTGSQSAALWREDIPSYTINKNDTKITLDIRKDHHVFREGERVEFELNEEGTGFKSVKVTKDGVTTDYKVDADGDFVKDGRIVRYDKNEPDGFSLDNFKNIDESYYDSMLDLCRDEESFNALAEAVRGSKEKTSMFSGKDVKARNAARDQLIEKIEAKKQEVLGKTKPEAERATLEAGEEVERTGEDEVKGTGEEEVKGTGEEGQLVGERKEGQLVGERKEGQLVGEGEEGQLVGERKEGELGGERKGTEGTGEPPAGTRTTDEGEFDSTIRAYEPEDPMLRAELEKGAFEGQETVKPVEFKGEGTADFNGEEVPQTVKIGDTTYEFVEGEVSTNPAGKEFPVYRSTEAPGEFVRYSKDSANIYYDDARAPYKSIELNENGTVKSTREHLTEWAEDGETYTNQFINRDAEGNILSYDKYKFTSEGKSVSSVQETAEGKIIKRFAEDGETVVEEVHTNAQGKVTETITNENGVKVEKLNEYAEDGTTLESAKEWRDDVLTHEENQDFVLNREDNTITIDAKNDSFYEMINLKKGDKLAYEVNDEGTVVKSVKITQDGVTTDYPVDKDGAFVKDGKILQLDTEIEGAVWDEGFNKNMSEAECRSWLDLCRDEKSFNALEEIVANQKENAKWYNFKTKSRNTTRDRLINDIEAKKQEVLKEAKSKAEQQVFEEGTIVGGETVPEEGAIVGGTPAPEGGTVVIGRTIEGRVENFQYSEGKVTSIFHEGKEFKINADGEFTSEGSPEILKLTESGESYVVTRKTETGYEFGPQFDRAGKAVEQPDLCATNPVAEMGKRPRIGKYERVLEQCKDDPQLLAELEAKVDAHMEYAPESNWETTWYGKKHIDGATKSELAAFKERVAQERAKFKVELGPEVEPQNGGTIVIGGGEARGTVIGGAAENPVNTNIIQVKDEVGRNVFDVVKEQDGYSINYKEPVQGFESGTTVKVRTEKGQFKSVEINGEEVPVEADGRFTYNGEEYILDSGSENIPLKRMKDLNWKTEEQLNAPEVDALSDARARLNSAREEYNTAQENHLHSRENFENLESTKEMYVRDEELHQTFLKKQEEIFEQAKYDQIDALYEQAVKDGKIPEETVANIEGQTHYNNVRALDRPTCEGKTQIAEMKAEALKKAEIEVPEEELGNIAKTKALIEEEKGIRQQQRDHERTIEQAKEDYIKQQDATYLEKTQDLQLEEVKFVNEATRTNALREERLGQYEREISELNSDVDYIGLENRIEVDEYLTQAEKDSFLQRIAEKKPKVEVEHTEAPVKTPVGEVRTQQTVKIGDETVSYEVNAEGEVTSINGEQLGMANKNGEVKVDGKWYKIEDGKVVAPKEPLAEDVIPPKVEPKTMSGEELDAKFTPKTEKLSNGDDLIAKKSWTDADGNVVETRIFVNETAIEPTPEGFYEIGGRKYTLEKDGLFEVIETSSPELKVPEHVDPPKNEVPEFLNELVKKTEKTTFEEVKGETINVDGEEIPQQVVVDGTEYFYSLEEGCYTNPESEFVIYRNKSDIYGVFQKSNQSINIKSIKLNGERNVSTVEHVYDMYGKSGNSTGQTTRVVRNAEGEFVESIEFDAVKVINIKRDVNNNIKSFTKDGHSYDAEGNLVKKPAAGEVTAPKTAWETLEPEARERELAIRLRELEKGEYSAEEYDALRKEITSSKMDDNIKIGMLDDIKLSEVDHPGNPAFNSNASATASGMTAPKPEVEVTTDPARITPEEIQAKLDEKFDIEALTQKKEYDYDITFEADEFDGSVKSFKFGEEEFTLTEDGIFQGNKGSAAKYEWGDIKVFKDNESMAGDKPLYKLSKNADKLRVSSEYTYTENGSAEIKVHWNGTREVKSLEFTEDGTTYSRYENLIDGTQYTVKSNGTQMDYYPKKGTFWDSTPEYTIRTANTDNCVMLEVREGTYNGYGAGTKIKFERGTDGNFNKATIKRTDGQTMELNIDSDGTFLNPDGTRSSLKVDKFGRISEVKETDPLKAKGGGAPAEGVTPVAEPEVVGGVKMPEYNIPKKVEPYENKVPEILQNAAKTVEKTELSVKGKVKTASGEEIPKEVTIKTTGTDGKPVSKTFKYNKDSGHYELKGSDEYVVRSSNKKYDLYNNDGQQQSINLNDDGTTNYVGHYENEGFEIYRNSEGAYSFSRDNTNGNTITRYSDNKIGNVSETKNGITIERDGNGNLLNSTETFTDPETGAYVTRYNANNNVTNSVSISIRDPKTHKLTASKITYKSDINGFKKGESFEWKLDPTGEKPVGAKFTNAKGEVFEVKLDSDGTFVKDGYKIEYRGSHQRYRATKVENATNSEMTPVESTPVNRPVVEVEKPAVEVEKPAVEVEKPAVEVKPLDFPKEVDARAQRVEIFRKRIEEAKSPEEIAALKKQAEDFKFDNGKGVSVQELNEYYQAIYELEIKNCKDAAEVDNVLARIKADNLDYYADAELDIIANIKKANKPEEIKAIKSRIETEEWVRDRARLTEQLEQREIELGLKKPAAAKIEVNVKLDDIELKPTGNQTVDSELTTIKENGNKIDDLFKLRTKIEKGEIKLTDAEKETALKSVNDAINEIQNRNAQEYEAMLDDAKTLEDMIAIRQRASEDYLHEVSEEAWKSINDRVNYEVAKAEFKVETSDVGGVECIVDTEGNIRYINGEEVKNPFGSGLKDGEFTSSTGKKYTIKDGKIEKVEEVKAPTVETNVKNMSIDELDAKYPNSTKDFNFDADGACVRVWKNEAGQVVEIRVQQGKSPVKALDDGTYEINGKKFKIEGEKLVEVKENAPEFNAEPADKGGPRGHIDEVEEFNTFNGELAKKSDIAELRQIDTELAKPDGKYKGYTDEQKVALKKTVNDRIAKLQKDNASNLDTSIQNATKDNIEQLKRDIEAEKQAGKINDEQYNELTRKAGEKQAELERLSPDEASRIALEEANEISQIATDINNVNSTDSYNAMVNRINNSTKLRPDKKTEMLELLERNKGEFKPEAGGGTGGGAGRPTGDDVPPSGDDVVPTRPRGGAKPKRRLLGLVGTAAAGVVINDKIKKYKTAMQALAQQQASLQAQQLLNEIADGLADGTMTIEKAKEQLQQALEDRMISQEVFDEAMRELNELEAELGADEDEAVVNNDEAVVDNKGSDDTDLDKTLNEPDEEVVVPTQEPDEVPKESVKREDIEPKIKSVTTSEQLDEYKKTIDKSGMSETDKTALNQLIELKRKELESQNKGSDQADQSADQTRKDGTTTVVRQDSGDKRDGRESVVKRDEADHRNVRTPQPIEQVISNKKVVIRQQQDGSPEVVVDGKKVQVSNDRTVVIGDETYEVTTEGLKKKDKQQTTFIAPKQIEQTINDKKVVIRKGLGGLPIVIFDGKTIKVEKDNTVDIEGIKYKITPQGKLEEVKDTTKDNTTSSNAAELNKDTYKNRIQGEKDDKGNKLEITHLQVVEFTKAIQNAATEEDLNKILADLFTFKMFKGRKQLRTAIRAKRNAITNTDDPKYVEKKNEKVNKKTDRAIERFDDKRKSFLGIRLGRKKEEPARQKEEPVVKKFPSDLDISIAENQEQKHLNLSDDLNDNNWT